MPLPNLLHPVSVTIQTIDTAATTYDPQTREPLRQSVYTTKTLQAQVRYRRLVDPEVQPTGLAEDVRGWLTVRRLDLTAVGYTPQAGDRITAIGGRTTELYLRTIEDMGHYGDQSGYTLLRLYFADRRPQATAPTW